MLVQIGLEDFRVATETGGMQLDDDSLLALFSKVTLHNVRYLYRGREGGKDSYGGSTRWLAHFSKVTLSAIWCQSLEGGGGGVRIANET